MRIIKYIFLLILLVTFAISIFVATQKGDFYVQRDSIIKHPKSTVFNYAYDYRNWKSFASWIKEDSKTEFTYSQDSIKKNRSFSWEGTYGKGDVKTFAIKHGDSIIQKMNFDGTSTELTWFFKDTIGGTKVFWKSKGTMSFKFKIKCALSGGVDKVIGNMLEKSLLNLGNTLDYEINTYTVNVNGIFKKLGCFYLNQTIICKISNVSKNLSIMIPNLVAFFKKNNIEMKGKPFVLYHTYDTTNGITKISVCIPTKEQIFTSPGSDITYGKLNPFQAVKTTLIGDYSHSKEAWTKTFDFISNNNLTRDTEISNLEIYVDNIEQIENPSKWKTEIYIPVKSKAVVVVKSVTFFSPKIIAPESKPEDTLQN